MVANKAPAGVLPRLIVPCGWAGLSQGLVEKQPGALAVQYLAFKRQQIPAPLCFLLQLLSLRIIRRVVGQVG